MKYKGMMEEQWDAYYRIVVPSDASPAEIEAIRHGFYTGAAAIMIMNRRLCKNDVPIAKGKAVIADVSRELGEFFSDRSESGVTH